MRVPRVPLTPLDALLAACARGDVEAAERLGSRELIDSMRPEDRRLLPEAAIEGRDETVAACLAAGFPVNTEDASGATALHHAAIHGRVAMVRRLLGADASIDIRDQEHHGTPLGWAAFGADFFRESRRGGDYVATVRALLDAGARPVPDAYIPAEPAVRAVLEPFLASAQDPDAGTPGG